ncbi:hypothetical protein [Aromatoleum evansii]|uniref:hypothetical protein n=1 Tax=Aromatoleum evansii TaxID=59406 RepID=UPI00145DDDA2|nr:hypothetical protein [Aromatoleum evansii]NMG28364.1 hypothetical protein [Aromatoleum evansii]
MMHRPIAERALIGVFAVAAMCSIYLAAYWTAPHVVWSSEHNGELEVKDICAKAPGCKAARMDIGFSGEARRPVYVAHLKLRQGTKPIAVTSAVREAMLAAITQQSIPFRWLLDARSVAVEVTYHDD